MGTEATIQTAEPVRLAEVVASLSLATDLGLGVPMEWALRSCLLAVRLGERIGLGEAERADLYYLALLRFIGCTSDADRRSAYFGDEIAAGHAATAANFGSQPDLVRFIVRYAGADQPPLRRIAAVATTMVRGPALKRESTTGHCEVAQRLAERIGFPSRISLALTQMFERWDGRGLPAGIAGEAIAPLVRIVQLAQDAELFHLGDGAERAVAVVRARAGHAYDPALADRFCREAADLLAVDAADPVWDAALAAEPGSRPTLAANRIDAALGAMADFADLVSPYTLGHSPRVAALAEAAARLCRLPAAEVIAVRRAGLVHDLGRVGISAAIWGKPGRLTDGEWERVRLHPYFTERVLTRAAGLAGFGRLAALHHERLDGSGYHRGLPGAMLPTTARVLAAADVYAAMTERRPHRPARPPEDAAAELERAVRAGRLDGEAVAAVLTAAGHTSKPPRASIPAGLSEREVEVLRLVAAGLSNPQIAARLSISRRTAGHHVQHIYDKIGLASRAGATLFALQHGLLPEPR